MENKKEFLVTIEHVVKVTIDMNKYTDEALRQYNEYWGLNEDNDREETLIELAEHIAKYFNKNGYLDKDLEGVVPEAQECKTKEYYVNVD